MLRGASHAHAKPWAWHPRAVSYSRRSAVSTGGRKVAPHVAVTLQGGATLRDAKLAYKTHGELNADKSNAIVYPTWYSGRHWDNEWLIGDGMALDPAEYFIVVPNMLGNGLSSSASRGFGLG